MVKHIVMFRFKEDFVAKIEEIKEDLEKLEDSIPSLSKMEVGVNVSDRNNAFDLVLVSEFETIVDLDAYRTHEEHQKVVNKLKKYASESVVADYLIS